MKKIISILALGLISTGALAISGHGYTILEHKVTISPGIKAYSVEKQATEKKSMMMGYNGANAYDVTTKVNVPTRVHGQHSITIQNLSGRTKDYTYGYWLQVMDKVYRVDERARLEHQGVVMVDDESHMENLIFPQAASYTLKACSYSSEAQTECGYATVSASN